MRKILFLLSLACCSCSFAQGVKIRDVFASMPDSVLPLVTKNNRLDCIDFIENNMPAHVNNMVGEPIELTALTGDYLKLTMSKVSWMEMKLVMTGDSTYVICVVRTYAGPVKDSSVSFYDQEWKMLDVKNVRPAVESFFANVPAEEASRKAEIVRMLQDMPFVQMSLEAGSEDITCEIQVGELFKKDREWAEKYRLPVKKNVKQLVL